MRKNRPPSSRTDQAAQSARFIEAARELGCDESPDAFEAAVKKVARHKPVDLDRSSDRSKIDLPVSKRT